jgi:serine/threonine protein kinase
MPRTRGRREPTAQAALALELLAREHAMPATAPSSPSLEGRVLAGRYRIVRSLGSGAMGRVYLAEHVQLGRACAVKVIRPPSQPGCNVTGLSSPSAQIERFRLEAQAASRLDHPNVLTVLDFGCELKDGLWYLVTEHLDGEDLVDVLESGQELSTGYVAAIVRQVCSALQHAHDHGVVHRDIKPENVRLVPRETDDGRLAAHVKVLDFGTAKLLDGTGRAAAGEPFVIGTPAYMSPEQASGRAIDGRSDLYSCGVLLFEMATGRLPFERSSPIAMAAAHVECRPPAPSAIRDDIDPELESLILWCLRKRPGDRPQTARELRDALDRLDTPSLRAHRATMAAMGLHSLLPPAPSPGRTEPAAPSRPHAEPASAFFSPSASTLASTLPSLAPVVPAATPMAPEIARPPSPSKPAPEGTAEPLAPSKTARRMRLALVAAAASALIASGSWLVLSDHTAAGVAVAPPTPALAHDGRPATPNDPPPSEVPLPEEPRWVIPSPKPAPEAVAPIEPTRPAAPDPTPPAAPPGPTGITARVASANPATKGTVKAPPDSRPPAPSGPRGPSDPPTPSTPATLSAGPSSPPEPSSLPAHPAEPALPAGLVDPWQPASPIP